MTKADKNCPHCGSSSILPISYGLKTDEAIEQNAVERKWVWGGCVMRMDENGGLKTHHCSNCNQSFNESNPFDSESSSNNEPQSSSDNDSLFISTVNDDQDSTFDEDFFMKGRQSLFELIDELLDGERDEELYAKALKEAEGDENEAEYIYIDLLMESNADDETK